MRFLFLVLALPAPLLAADPIEIPLWDKGAPGFESRKDEKEVRDVQKSGEYKVTNVHNPTITIFLPTKEKATGTAVVLAPAAATASCG
ncbi:MAG TPA: hypothetical protein VHR66_16205 [Gemmataceae bacterium]|jgi:hypothetical protein|nr:hypothetical protein [Gemmataceae bacterium]